MTAAVDLTAIASPDLEQLAREVRRGRLPCPLSGSALTAAGLGHLARRLDGIAALDRLGVLAILDAVLAERALRPVSRVDLVWTGPEATVSMSRDTVVVVRELFESAKRTVLIAGYSFDHGTQIFRPLYEGMRDRRLQATLYLDLDGAFDVDLKVRTFLNTNWPFGEPRPTIYFDPRSVGAGARASLHAKCLVIDDSVALVTSANFTDRGQTRNIEVGALIADNRFAATLAGQWRAATAAGLFTAWQEER